MRHKLERTGFALLLGLATGAASASTEIHTANISAAAFRAHRVSFGGSGNFMGSDGYLYSLQNDDCCAAGTVARVSLPAGAEIKQICMFSKRTDPELGRTFINLTITTLATPGDPVPAYAGIIALGNSSGATVGYRVDCSAVGSFAIVQASTDVNEGDGEEYVALHLRGFVSGEDGFGGVAIRWRRAVSPAPEAATFGDVPVGHPLFPFVEALGSSGTSAGCGGGNFCPDAPLTRSQMAVLFTKALGLHWPD